MENKKLLKILLKDMSELLELIAEIRSKGHFEKFEIDFIYTRAGGIMQLLNILDIKESQDKSNSEEFITKNKGERLEEGSSQNKKEHPDINDFESQKNLSDLKHDNEIVHTNPDIIQNTLKHTEETIINEEEEQDINENGMLEEDNKQIDTKSCLGDSFLKGKSINDIITEQNKLEFKLSNRPVSSIKSAIGINDRFQYIRELFDNDAKKFYDSLEKLDSMNNLQEASDYLRTNFKWKKNELSLKFINLVKRRYPYE